MSVQIGEVNINLRMSMAQFRADTQAGTAEASSAVKTMASDMSSSTSEARGSLMLLNGELGIHMPRHLTALIAQIPGLSSAFATMLPLVGVFAAVMVVYKLIEAHKKLQDELDKGWATADHAIENHNDELQLSIDKYKELLAKLDGLPVNHIAVELDQARVEADKLADSLSKDLAGLIKLTEGAAHGSIMTAILGTSGSGQAADVAKGLADALGKVPHDSHFAENYQKELLAAHARAQSEIDKNNAASAAQAAQALQPNYAEHAGPPVTDFTAANVALQEFQVNLSKSYDSLQLLGQSDALHKQVVDGTAAAKVIADLRKTYEDNFKAIEARNAEVADSKMAQDAEEGKSAEELFKTIEAHNAEIADSFLVNANLRRHLDDEIYKHAAETYKLEEAAALEDANFKEKIGLISAAQRIALDKDAEEKLYQNRLQALNREISLMEDDPDDPLHARKRADAVEIIEQTHQNNMTRIEHAGIEQRFAAETAAFNSLNQGMSTLVGNLLSGNNSIVADVKKMLSNMLASWLDYFVQLEMKALEASVMMKMTGIFGGGGVPGIGSMPAGGAMPGGVPGLAEGGRMSSGDVAVVGENGPELWRPDTTGSIVPASKSGDSGDTNNTLNQFHFHGVTDFDSFKQNKDQLAAQMYAMMATAARRKG